MIPKAFGLAASTTGVVAAALLAVPPKPAAPKSAPKQEAPRAVNVTGFWSVTCAKCHGENGGGGGAGTGTLLTREGFDQKNDRPYFDIIKNGHETNGMPAYGATMTDEEVWAQVVHIRELQARALRAEFGAPKPDANGVYQGQRAGFKIETVAEGGFKDPWALDFLPDGRMLVTNRGGRLDVLGRDGKRLNSVEGLPPVLPLGQGGLMEVAVHPQYARNGWIYLSLADPAKSGERKALTKIVRGKLSPDGKRWTSGETIFEAPQRFYSDAGIHFGSKIVFDGKGHVVFSVGERGGNERALDPAEPIGKIYRLNDDGSVPKDAPFAKNPKAFPGILSLGHRNPQGLAFGLDGRLWDTEHAPRGGDEVNLIAPGANYGWPLVGHGINYNDSPRYTPFPELSAKGPLAGQKVVVPIFRWLPSTGSSGLDVARGAAFPAWKGDLLAGGLAGQNLDRIRTKDGAFVEREELLQGMGRVRDVAVAPDGTVYVVLNGPDKIVRLVPAG